jgi:hypothetical protein
MNYKNCCPTYKPIIKTIFVAKSESQHVLNITSCCKEYVKPINEGIKHQSYDQVLRRRRGQAMKQ